MGSGCGTVVRAVASNTRRFRFETIHQQLLFSIYPFTDNCLENAKNNEKEAINGHLNTIVISKPVQGERGQISSRKIVP